MNRMPDDSSPAGDIAIVGEGSSPGHSVSMKALQAIYNEITGKSEELSKRYEKAFQISFADLEQLHAKIEQACEQYNIESRNETITLYLVDDTKEQFSSFERFRIYNKSSTSAVESVLVKYNLLIILPKTRRAQSYTLSVRITSQITLMRRMREEISRLPSGLIRLMGVQTAVVTVGYVDYMVARNLLTICDGWFDSIGISQTPRFLKFVRKYSDLFRPSSAYFLGALTLCAALKVLPKILAGTSDLQGLARFMLVSLSALFFSYRLGRYIGGHAENSVHAWNELGYILLNRGDEKELDEAKRANRLSLVKAWLDLLWTLVLGVIASLIAGWIFYSANGQ
jgi:hypothetical protein